MLCGPKLSLCVLIISVWGVIKLVLMGIFYHVKSVALAGDLPLHDHYDTAEDFYAAADRGYITNAFNCWIAAGLYLVTMVISGHQFYMNSRSTLTM